VDGVLVQSTFGHLRTLGYIKVEVANDRVVDYENKLIWLWADNKLKASPEIASLVKEVNEAIGSELISEQDRSPRMIFIRCLLSVTA
jgi:hypothetical protein